MNSLEQWTAHYTDMAAVTEDFYSATTQGLDSFASAMSDFMITGEADWKGWCASLLRAYLDTINKMIVANALSPLTNALTAGLTAGLTNLFGGGAGVSSGGAMGSATNMTDAANIADAWLAAPMAHSGWNVGYDSPDFFRGVPSSLFASAPRLHSGLRSDEFPAILQKGETVIPKNQSQSQQISVKNILVYDMKQAQIEAMNSAEGEKVIIQKVARNRRALG